MVVKKHDVLALLHEMPDDIDTDDLMYRLYLRQKIEAAEDAAEAGDVIPHDEVVRRSDEWLQ
jgi:predicted transcriptional regulator